MAPINSASELMAVDIIHSIIIDWQNAPHKQKRAVIDQYARITGKSVKALYRAIGKVIGPSRKKRSDAGQYKNPALCRWTRTIWAIKLSPPAEAGVIPTDIALKLAIENGELPAEAANIDLSTYYRAARDLNLNRTPGRWTRFEAKYANLALQTDASTSKFFYIHRKVGNDYVLKLHRPAANYKNKPTPCDRLRPWIYAAVDDFSGKLYAQCYAATGENAADGIEFLSGVFAQGGLPNLLYLDNGPISKALPVKEYLKRLDVKLVTGTPYHSRARGKIERTWRTGFNRFELSFFAVAGCDSIRLAPGTAWKNFEITLSEYNRQLKESYLIGYNARPHRYQKDISRADIWWRSVNARGGIVKIPDTATSSIFSRHPRVVRGGFLAFNNQQYEVIGLDEGAVWVYEGIFNDRIIVENIKTHKKHQVQKFVPLSFGEKPENFTSEAEQLLIDNPVFLTKSAYENPPQNQIQSIPVRSTEKTVEDPFIITTHPAKADGSGPIPPPVFTMPSERYEHLIKQRAQGTTLTKHDLEFMKFFQKSDTYKQADYSKLENHFKREANL